MARQFISICGHSGAGKKTLIRKLLADDPPELRIRFRIYGTVAAFNGEFRPLHEIETATEDTLLHFWQDHTRKWVDKLREKFPADMHRIILLWRPYDVHSKALIARNVEYKPTPDVVQTNWKEMRVPHFQRHIANGIEVELVLSDKSEPLYPELKDWPT